MTDILKIDDETIPKFPKHVKFRYNKARDEWVILAPERLVKLDPIAVEILKMVIEKDMEPFLGQMELNMLDNLKTQKDMGKVHTSTQKEVVVLVSLEKGR